jgi:hypothetical protein
MTTAHAASVSPGTWRTSDAVMTIGAKQTRIDLGTGSAAIDGPLKTDAAGRFDATGHFELFKPGPQRADQPPKLLMAHIQGRVTANTVEMTMRVDGERAMRKFIFTQGRVAKLIRPM